LWNKRECLCQYSRGLLISPKRCILAKTELQLPHPRVILHTPKNNLYNIKYKKTLTGGQIKTVAKTFCQPIYLPRNNSTPSIIPGLPMRPIKEVAHSHYSTLQITNSLVAYAIGDSFLCPLYLFFPCIFNQAS